MTQHDMFAVELVRVRIMEKIPVNEAGWLLH